MNTTPNNQYFLIALAAFIMLSMTSCNWFQDSPDDMVIDVPDEFRIHAEEIFGEGEMGLRIVIKTTEPYPCSNAEIKTEAGLSQDFIDLTIKAIEEPTDCDSIEHTLSHTNEFFPITRDVYYLNLSLRNVIDNSGSVRIYDDRIELDVMDPSGIIIEPSTTWRLPETTIWGYAQSNENDFNGVLIDFVTDLSIISKSIVLKEGTYSGFQVNGSGVLDFNDIAPGMSLQTFYFKFEGEESELSDLLESYRSDHGSKAQFVIYNTDGKVF